MVSPDNVPSLLPDRYPHKDFFIADIFDNLPFKDDMASMGYPIFSLSKNKDLRTINYEKDGISILVSPSFEYGLPTIFDKDVLLYCGSLLMEQVNRGILPPKTLRVSTHDLLVATNRTINGGSYDLLKKALDRLQGVSIKTNIRTNKREITSAFGVIDSYEIIESSRVKDRMLRLEITLSDWFYNSIVSKEVLTISRDYFRLKKPLERRLYEIARKHCGNQTEWTASLQGLYEKTGSQSPLGKFRFFLHAIAKANHLPGYTIQFVANDVVTFRNRKVEEAPAQADLFDIPAISTGTIRKGAMLVQEAGTGWCYQELRTQFTQSLVNGFKPENINGAFINFIKKKVATRP